MTGLWYVLGFAVAGASFVFLTIGLAWLISHRTRGSRNIGVNIHCISATMIVRFRTMNAGTLRYIVPPPTMHRSHPCRRTWVTFSETRTERCAIGAVFTPAP